MKRGHIGALLIGAGLVLQAQPATGNDLSRLTVEIVPAEAAFDNARWRLNNRLQPLPPLPDTGHPDDLPEYTQPTDPDYQSARLTSGATLRGMPDGIYVLEFLPATAAGSPCRAPAAQWVQIRPNVATAVTGVYDCTAAAPARDAATEAGLRVVLSPAAASAGGAAWRIKGQTDWQPSGALVSNLADGTHVIEYRPVSSGPCTGTPAAEPVDYYSGQLIVWPVDYGGAGCAAGEGG